MRHRNHGIDNGRRELRPRWLVMGAVLAVLTGCSSGGAETDTRSAETYWTYPSTTTGTVRVSVNDAQTRAPLVGAAVVAQPGGVKALADSTGVATLRLSAGTYDVEASASGLTVSGNTVVPTGTVTAKATGVVVTVGANVAVALKLTRIDPKLNLVPVHAPGGAFTATNCMACHGRHSEIESEGGTIAPFHNLEQHSDLSCTYCHRAVDLAQSSGATIRKQVDVKAVCRTCHPSYPASFIRRDD